MLWTAGAWQILDILVAQILRLKHAGLLRLDGHFCLFLDNVELTSRAVQHPLRISEQWIETPAFTHAIRLQVLTLRAYL